MPFPSLHRNPLTANHVPDTLCQMPNTLNPAAMKITCHKCLHYYVTWDPQFPHGCRTMGFKSRQMPMIEVRRTMHGKDCLSFETKKTGNTPPVRPDRN